MEEDDALPAEAEANAVGPVEAEEIGARSTEADKNVVWSIKVKKANDQLSNQKRLMLKMQKQTVSGQELSSSKEEANSP